MEVDTTESTGSRAAKRTALRSCSYTADRAAGPNPDAAAGRLTGKELVTHRLSLEDITDGFRQLWERSGDPIKMVFVP